MTGAAQDRKKMETLVRFLSIVALSVAAVLIVSVAGAAIVAVVEWAGKDEAEDRPSAAQPSSLKGDAQ